MTVSVELAYPGDGVLLEVVVENSSTMPAKLTGFTVTGTDSDFEVTQAAGGPAVNEVLAANGGTEEESYNFTGFRDFFSTNLTIGSSTTQSGIYRGFIGTLSDIVVKIEE